MAFQIGGGGKQSLSDINVTPLVDVMLVMLVIFMVTAPMLSGSKTKVKLPPVDTGQALELTDQDVIFVLDLDQKIQFYNCPTCEKLELSNMVSKLKDNPRIKEVKQVYIYGDQRLQYRFVLQVMARLRETGVIHVGLVTDPSGLKINKLKATP
jgi:biopolymer transport protein TolR